MSKHTKGKWIIEDDYIVDEEGEIICHVYLRSEDDIGEQIMTEANAQLIAAAPELLERLKKNQEFNHNILSYFGWDIENEDKINELIDKNREAIQKAEGDTNDKN